MVTLNLFNLFINMVNQPKSVQSVSAWHRKNEFFVWYLYEVLILLSSNHMTTDVKKHLGQSPSPLWRFLLKILILEVSHTDVLLQWNDFWWPKSISEAIRFQVIIIWNRSNVFSHKIHHLTSLVSSTDNVYVSNIVSAWHNEFFLIFLVNCCFLWNFLFSEWLLTIWG